MVERARAERRGQREKGAVVAWELRFTLEDRPGTLAGASKALGDAGINILAVAAFSMPQGFGVRFLVEDAEAARRALEGAGITVEGMKEGLVVEVEDRPGQLAATAGKLGAAGVNIESCYVLGESAGRKRLVLTADDTERARSILGG